EYRTNPPSWDRRSEWVFNSAIRNPQLVGDALGDGHEDVFDGDGFFLESFELEAVGDEAFGNETAVASTIAKGHANDLAFRVDGCRTDFRQCSQPLRGFLVPLADGNQEYVAAARLPHFGVPFLDAPVEQELAAFDNP